MPIVLSIGYVSFLIKNEAAAIGALKALTGAMRVKSRHVHRGDSYREVYWVCEENDEVGLKTIRANQIVACDPDAIKPVEVTLQLGQGGQS